MNIKHLLLFTTTAFTLLACSTETYVSQDNIDKYDERVSKFLIAECMLPQREVFLAVAEHFEFDKYEVKAEDQTELSQFVRDIRKLKGRISIVAHTDYQGAKAYNEQLSLRRANSLKTYLSQYLVNENYEWEVSHYGETMPLLKEKTLAANAANRRAYVMFEQTIQSDIQPCSPPEPDRKMYVALTSHFDFDDSAVKPEDTVELDKIADKINGLQGHILIAGHTDYLGSASYNQKLALERAKAVQAYLETQLSDIKSFVWELKSFGENEPLVNEQSLSANAENRRVFVVFKEGNIEQSQGAITPL